MIVVADAGPIQYLLRIGAIGVLAPLYQRLLVPHTVALELQQPNTPATVRAWIAQPPAWCEIRSDLPIDPSLLTFLDRGEAAAITLAQSLQADRLLIDDLAGRREAERRQVFVTGTLGVLVDAHLAGLLDFEQKLSHLRQTNFYVSDDVVARVRRDIARSQDHPAAEA
jgi:predicted nucleic acid-binding protein